MSTTALTAAQIENLRRSLDGTGLSVEHAEAMLNHILVTMPAMVLANLGKVISASASPTTLKAVDVTTLADKAVVFVESTLQWFEYDADSAAVEALGPPATVVAPTTGTGRYIALTLGGSGATKSYVDTQDTAAIASALATLNTRLRAVGDVAQVQALVVATLVDKAVIYVEDLRQFYGYDAISTALDVTGVSIKPTSGAGAYLALTTPAPASATAASMVWFHTGVATALGVGVEEPVGANGTFGGSNKEAFRCPGKGTLSLWLIPKGNIAGVDGANTCVFKLFKSDGTVLISKTFTNADAPTTFPTGGTPNLLGTCALAEGDLVGWEFTNGGTVALPALNLQFDLRAIA